MIGPIPTRIPDNTNKYNKYQKYIKDTQITTICYRNCTNPKTIPIRIPEDTIKYQDKKIPDNIAIYRKQCKYTRNNTQKNTR